MVDFKDWINKRESIISIIPNFFLEPLHSTLGSNKDLLVQIQVVWWLSEYECSINYDSLIVINFPVFVHTIPYLITY